MQTIDLDKDFSLIQLAEVWISEWRWIAASVALGFAIACAHILTSAPKYEAEMLIQVGQVGQVGQQMQQGGIVVESPLHAIERMKTGAFQKEAAKLSGYVQWIQSAETLPSPHQGFCSFQLIKNTDLIQVRTAADSQENAIKIAQSIVATLAKRHKKMSEASVARLSTELKFAENKLSSAESELMNLVKVLSNTNLKDDRFSQFSLLMSVKQIKEQDLYSQRQLIMEIKIALSEPFTHTAKVLEEIHSIDRPVSPKKSLILIGWLINGLLLGLVLTAVRHLWQIRKIKIKAGN